MLRYLFLCQSDICWIIFSFWSTLTQTFWQIVTYPVIPYPTFMQLVTFVQSKKLSVYAECIPLIFWESVSLWCSECQFNPLVIKSSRKTNKQNQKPPYQFNELNWSGGSKQCQNQTKARTFGSQEQGKGSEITVFQQHQAVRSAVQETQALVSSWNLIMLVPSH